LTIQALRAYAAIAVVVFHTGFVVDHLNPAGAFGVHVFFVISGYIMTGICETDSHDFLTRRLIRICPPYWALTLLLFVFASYHPGFLKSTRPDAIELIKSLFFLPFCKESGLIRPILFVGWSLNYEMFFYILLAFALKISRRKATLIASGAIVLVVFVSLPLRRRSTVAEFYSSPMMFEFVLGIISFYLVRAVPCSILGRLNWLCAVAVTTSLIWLPCLEAYRCWPSVPEAIRFSPASFLLVSAASVLAKGGNDIRRGLLVLLGDASYIMYLLHPYLLEGLRLLGPRIPLLARPTLAGCAVDVIFVAVVSIVVHLTIERPLFGRLGRLIRSGRRDFSPHTVAIGTSAPMRRR